MVSFDKFKIDIKEVHTDGDIKKLTSSMQTSLNLFSSKILELSTFKS
jgi:hypothetical protein